MKSLKSLSIALIVTTLLVGAATAFADNDRPAGGGDIIDS